MARLPKKLPLGPPECQMPQSIFCAIFLPREGRERSVRHPPDALRRDVPSGTIGNETDSLARAVDRKNEPRRNARSGPMRFGR